MTLALVPSPTDLLGYGAAGPVFLTFTMRTVLGLRAMNTHFWIDPAGGRPAHGAGRPVAARPD